MVITEAADGLRARTLRPLKLLWLRERDRAALRLLALERLLLVLLLAERLRRFRFRSRTRSAEKVNWFHGLERVAEHCV